MTARRRDLCPAVRCLHRQEGVGATFFHLNDLHDELAGPARESVVEVGRPRGPGRPAAQMLQ